MYIHVYKAAAVNIKNYTPSFSSSLAFPVRRRPRRTIIIITIIFWPLSPPPEYVWPVIIFESISALPPVRENNEITV